MKKGYIIWSFDHWSAKLRDTMDGLTGLTEKEIWERAIAASLLEEEYQLELKKVMLASLQEAEAERKHREQVRLEQEARDAELARRLAEEEAECARRLADDEILAKNLARRLAEEEAKRARRLADDRKLAEELSEEEAERARRLADDAKLARELAERDAKQARLTTRDVPDRFDLGDGEEAEQDGAEEDGDIPEDVLRAEEESKDALMKRLQKKFAEGGMQLFYDCKTPTNVCKETCQICTDELPLCVLTCGHTMCRQCFTSTAIHVSPSALAKPCPFCNDKSHTATVHPQWLRSCNSEGCKGVTTCATHTLCAGCSKGKGCGGCSTKIHL